MKIDGYRLWEFFNGRSGIATQGSSSHQSDEILQSQVVMASMQQNAPLDPQPCSGRRGTARISDHAAHPLHQDREVSPSFHASRTRESSTIERG